MKKYLLLLIFIFLITGCFKKDVNEEYKNYINLAKEEAIKYINNKYSFNVNTVNIKNVYLLKDKNVKDQSYNGIARVEFKYDGILFNTTIDYLKKDMSQYYDNYEQDVVINAIKDYYFMQLSLSTENSKIYMNKSVIEGSQMNPKFNDADTFLSNISDNSNASIIIITLDRIDDNLLRDISRKYKGVMLDVYKLYDVDLIKFNQNILLDGDRTSITANIFSNSKKVYVEKEFICDTKENCKYNQYSIDHLGYLVYGRSLESDNINIERIDVSEIDSYQDKVKKCGMDLIVYSAYKASTTIDKDNMSNRALTIYNMSTTSSEYINNFKIYPVIIDEDVYCYNNFVANTSYLKNGLFYILIVGE